MSTDNLTIKCEKWEEFFSAVRLMRIDGSGRIFRGHESAEWKLSSTWERELTRSKHPDLGLKEARHLCKYYLDLFKDFAIGLPGIPAKDLCEEDWWALARHYGLLTPLLDWTRSPYVAAYFACI